MDGKFGVSSLVYPIRILKEKAIDELLILTFFKWYFKHSFLAFMNRKLGNVVYST